MAGAWAYDLMYRWWAPWDSVGVREDLRRLLDQGDVTAATHPRAVDLGCGTGANVVFLAQQGFTATGIDFSPVAIDKAEQRAAEAGMGDRCHFVTADLTAAELPSTVGTFDLLLDFGAIDDLRGPGREAAARNVQRLSHAGSVFLFWCFYGRREELPTISFHGPSKLAPSIEPGEEHELFADAFDIHSFTPPRRRDGVGEACFLLTRR